MLIFSKNHSLVFLRLSLGIIFLWFGFLKFFPGVSPAEELAGQTFSSLTLGTLSPFWANMIIAAWETAIGLGFLTGKYLKQTIYIMLLHMLGTFTPLFLYPDLSWRYFPYAASIEGQYIIKNIVLISGALVLLTSNKK